MLWIPLSDQEMTTIVVALRTWVQVQGSFSAVDRLPESMKRDVPLSAEQIEVLCQRLTDRHSTQRLH